MTSTQYPQQEIADMIRTGHQREALAVLDPAAARTRWHGMSRRALGAAVAAVALAAPVAANAATSPHTLAVAATAMRAAVAHDVTVGPGMLKVACHGKATKVTCTATGTNGYATIDLVATFRVSGNRATMTTPGGPYTPQG